MAHKIDTVSARSKLKLRREPFWQRISKGFHVGFRKMSNTSNGIWLFRHIDTNGVERERTLGVLDQWPPHERFDQAVVLARASIEEASVAPPSRRALDVLSASSDLEYSLPEKQESLPCNDMTVGDACHCYVAHIREMKGDKAADDLAQRYRRWVNNDPIAKLPLIALTRGDFDNYRRRLLATPVRANYSGGTRVRSKDTVNRDMASLRAALNRALDDQKVATDSAWRVPLRAYKNVSRRRGLYLDRDQRRALIACAPEPAAQFLRALSTLPLRPGALAALTVADFDPRLNVLRIGIDKSGQDRRIKVPAITAQLFSAEQSDRSPAAPLLSRADGQAWSKDYWKDPIKEAARKAGLPAACTAYTLRHSVITDLVHGGLDLLTVAQLSGTSVAMIEKHYGHLRGEVAAEALAKLAL
jgi:integrase